MVMDPLALSLTYCFRHTTTYYLLPSTFLSNASKTNGDLACTTCRWLRAALQYMIRTVPPIDIGKVRLLLRSLDLKHKVFRLRAVPIME